MKQKQISKQRHQLALAALGLLVGASVLQGCKDDDVLTGQPSWLGNSIYERLEEDGQYKTMLRLIDDLGQHEVLSHTGSKTLFAANDSAFQAWFAKNSWGVSSYDRLSLAQKKLLFNNSMVNNAYLIELLSNGRPQGEDRHPEEGRTMRRATATSVYDSVQIMKPSQMPLSAAWDEFRSRGKSIPILKDHTSAPMIHFLPAFMKINKFTNEDLEVLTNHQANNINEAWVNGKKVVERDITCKNGYIQKVNGVIESAPNMAEIIHQHPSMSKWAELLDRFSAPYYHAEGTREYNRLYNNEDSVYVLRYYADIRSDGRTEDNDGSYNLTPDGQYVRDLLKFDPGWNQYIDDSGEANMNYDAGAMLVPTNEALQKWWDKEGYDLQTEYGLIDSIPHVTIKKLLRVNMLPILTEAIPSKFNQVLNDAKNELGITMADVDSVFMGCNGVVYMTNKVFTPAEFSSVAYPALAHPTIMNLIYQAIDELGFLPYLLSMDSKYSLLLPTNNAMLWYVDPYTYGTENQDGIETPQVVQFVYDDNRKAIRAYRYTCFVDENGEITLDESKPRQEITSSDIYKDMLKRLIDQLIIVGDIEDGHEFYKSKGGTPLRVFRDNGRLAFSGGWQIEHNNKPLHVNSEDIYEKENGKSYIINSQMPLTTDQSVYMTLEKHEEFSKFLELLVHDGADMMAKAIITSKATYEAGQQSKSYNMRLFDNYNYTIYAPTNNSIQDLIDKGLLPTWEDYEEQTDSIWGTEEAAAEAQAIIKGIIVNFLRYHIQDHAIMIGMAPENGKYENLFETMRRNLETGRFYPLTVNNEPGQMWVQDARGNKRNVVKTDGLYNNICREYWFKSTGQCYMASDAVVHQIDGVLLAEEMTPWKELLNKNVRRK
ncbi:MAG: fasciclin domain-containing protein [Prevotella sp.]|nr:fasciclin domain-containing protein [Prevotella sp.]